MYTYTYIHAFQQSSHVSKAKHARGKYMTMFCNGSANKRNGADNMSGKSFSDWYPVTDCSQENS